jgi:hypothetical protein
MRLIEEVIPILIAEFEVSDEAGRHIVAEVRSE